MTSIVMIIITVIMTSIVMITITVIMTSIVMITVTVIMTIITVIMTSIDMITITVIMTSIVMITITVIMTSIVISKYASNTKINITMLIYLSLINVSWDKRRFSTAIEALPPSATVPQAFCLSVAWD